MHMKKAATYKNACVDSKQNLHIKSTANEIQTIFSRYFD